MAEHAGRARRGERGEEDEGWAEKEKGEAASSLAIFGPGIDGKSPQHLSS